jgi:hypothetical protein
MRYWTYFCGYMYIIIEWDIEKIYKYILKVIDWLCFKFDVIWVLFDVYQISLKLCDDFNVLNLMMFDEISNDINFFKFESQSTNKLKNMFVLSFLRFFMNLY